MTHIYEGEYTLLSGYQNKDGGMKCPIVNAITKAYIAGKPDPVILVVNYATLVDDDDEKESLLVPFEMMAHGLTVDMRPRKYGGTCGMLG